MEFPGRTYRRIVFWLRRRRMGEDLRLEMEAHRALREDALEREGIADAAAASRRALGNVTLAREEARDVWIWPWFDGVARDLRYAVRGLRRRPGFAAASILTIAVGTAALASVLSVVYAVLIRPAPYPGIDRIVQIAQVANGRTRPEVSTIDVLALRDGSPSLSHVTIAWFSQASVTDGGMPERARLVYTDAQAFELLGVQPLIGRLPAARDENPGGEPIVVIGYGLWSSQFASDPEIVGRVVRIDSRPHVVIGVMPAAFRFPAPYWAPGDLWLLRGPSHASWPRTRAQTVLAFGRLADGRTIEQAQLEADVVAAGLGARYPDPGGPIGLRVTTWAETVRAGARPRLMLILGAAGVLFAIVCVNVVNLLLGRGLERERELAARIALGAGRRRIVRQVLTETAVLFAAGGGAGVLAAIWGSHLIVSMQSFSIPRMNEATVDLTVAGAAMAIALAAAAIVGLVPALQAAGVSGIVDMQARGASGSRRWRRIQRTLVAAEIALALVLLSGAGVLLEGARTLARVDPGFDVNGLLHARVNLPREKYATAAAQAAFYERAIAALLDIPGVVAAGAVDVPPGVGGTRARSVLLDGDSPPTSARDLRSANVRVVSAGYLGTLGLTPRAGRFFAPSDPPAVPIAVVNDAFVRQYMGNQAAVGRRLRVRSGGVDALDPLTRTIVGVVADLKEWTLYRPAPPTVYVPIPQGDATRMALIARTAGSTGDLVPAVRAAVMRADAEQAAFGFMALKDLMDSELSLNRLNLALLGVLAAVSLFLAVVGAYGVTAHAVRHRTREIGIRLALGVPPRGIERLLLAEGGALVLVGVACGAVAAVWSAGLLRAAVYGIDSTSAGTFVSAGVVLAAAVLGGCYFPARRASRVDPAIVLRAD